MARAPYALWIPVAVRGAAQAGVRSVDIRGLSPAEAIEGPARYTPRSVRPYRRASHGTQGFGGLRGTFGGNCRYADARESSVSSSAGRTPREHSRLRACQMAQLQTNRGRKGSPH